MEEIRVVPAGPEQVDRVVALADEFLLAAGEPIRPDQATVLRGMLADPSIGRGWLASVGPEAVGYATVISRVSFFLGGRIALVDHIYVRRAFRRRGIGRLLLETALDAVRAEGFVAAEIYGHLANRSAINLYGSLGFRARPYTVLGLDFVEAGREG